MVRSFFLNPDDAYSRREMEDMIIKTTEANQLIEKLNTLETKMMTNGRLISGNIDRIKKMMIQSNASVITKDEVQILMDTYKTKWTSHLQNVTDRTPLVKNTQVQHKLNTACGKIARSKEIVFDAAEEALSDPNEPDGLQQLANLIAEVEVSNNTIEKEGHLDKSFSSGAKAMRDAGKKLLSRMEQYCNSNSFKKLLSVAVEALKRLLQQSETLHTTKAKDANAQRAYELFHQQLEREIISLPKAFEENIGKLAADRVHIGRTEGLLDRVRKTTLESQKLHPLERKIHSQGEFILSIRKYN